MMSSLYGLNKSFSKKVYLGIEIGDNGYGEVVIRLTGKDFIGVRFSPEKWQNFVGTFVHVDKFFAQNRDSKDMLDQRVVGNGFSTRFTTSHGDRAIEIEEEEDRSANKKFRHNIVMKCSTYWTLKKYIACIQAKIDLLIKKLPMWNCIMEKAIRSSGQTPNGDQRNVADEINEKVLEELCEKNHLAGDLELNKAEITSIYNEIIYLDFVSDNFLLDVSDS